VFAGQTRQYAGADRLRSTGGTGAGGVTGVRIRAVIVRLCNTAQSYDCGSDSVPIADSNCA
jgi:hypothetical protein